MKIGFEKKVKKVIKDFTVYCARNIKIYRDTWKTESNKDRNDHINRPVRTACAAVQLYNGAMHITMHNTQTQFCYSIPASRPTSHLRYSHKEARAGVVFP